MKHIKKSGNSAKVIVMNGIESINETAWAIGTSIAGTGALKLHLSILSSK